MKTEADMIKSERIEIVIEILITQMNHWMLFPIVMVVTALSRLFGQSTDTGRPEFLLWVICGLFPIALFFVRYYAEHLWFLFLCHALVAACSLILPVSSGLFGRVICILCAAYYVIYSLILRLQENAAVYSTPIHPLAALGASLVSNFILHRQEGAPDWDHYYVFILIGVFACYAIIYYLRQYLKFLQVNRSSTGYLPAGEILRSGIGYVLPYTLFGAVVLVLSLNAEWLEPILQALKAGIMAVLRFIFGHSSGESMEEMIQTPEGTNKKFDPKAMGLPTEGTFWLWEVLEYVAIVLFFCGAAFCIVKALIWFVKLVRYRFGNKTDNNNFVLSEEAVYDIHEKCGITKKDSGEKRVGFFRQFSPAERIRRLYKKQVLSGGIEVENKAELNCMTAKECSQKIRKPDMAVIYERTRYSDSEITSEDVKRMKTACGGK